MSKEVQTAVVDMAAFLQSFLHTDAKAGTITADEHAYAESLKLSDLNVEDARKYRQHDKIFAAGATMAFGQAANALAKENNEVNAIDFTIPTIEKGSFSTSWERSREVPVGVNNPEAGMRTVYGAIGPRAWKTGFTEKTGQMAAVLGMISEEAKNLFEKTEV